MQVSALYEAVDQKGNKQMSGLCRIGKYFGLCSINVILHIKKIFKVKGVHERNNSGWLREKKI